MNNVVNVRALITIVVSIDLLAFVLSCIMQKISFGLNLETFSLIGILTTIAWAFLSIFRVLLWKIPLLQGWLVLVPNLNGSWHGKLESTWIDPETNESPNPIDTTAVIKQTLTMVTIDLDTDGMKSTSTVASVQFDPHRRSSTISYVYLSDPITRKKAKNVIHYGAAKLNVMKKGEVLSLDGRYWTDNKTRGDVHLERIE